MRRPDIPVLTTLRFPAAFAIVLYHFLAYTLCPRWIWEGFGAGVSFFYVLSGFILYYNYVDLTDRGFFWVARCARIWPVHLVMLIAAFVVLPFDALDGHASWWITLPANALLFHAWMPFQGSALSYNGVSWSLSVEAFFYFMFPTLLAAIKRLGSATLLVSTFVVGLSLVTAAAFLIPTLAGFVGTFNPVCRLFEFVLGMATCRFWLGGERLKLSASVWTVLELLALFLGLGFVVGLPQFLHWIGSNNPVAIWLGSGLCALGFAALIWIFAHQAGGLARPLSLRWCEWLGEISFSVYMCHQLLLRSTDTVLRTGAWNATTYFFFYLAATFLLSAALFHLVETPARHAIVSAFKRRRLTSPNAGRSGAKAG